MLGIFGSSQTDLIIKRSGEDNIFEEKVKDKSNPGTGAADAPG
jgi:hypothetical protein